MQIVRSAVGRPKADARLLAAPSSPRLGAEAETEKLAQRLCLELQAMTGNASVSVLIEILPRRLRVTSREIERAVAFGVEHGLIERRVDCVALRDEGRAALRNPWPPTESQRDGEVRRHSHAAYMG